jgi:hypothetical protein
VRRGVRISFDRKTSCRTRSSVPIGEPLNRYRAMYTLYINGALCILYRVHRLYRIVLTKPCAYELRFGQKHTRTHPWKREIFSKQWLDQRRIQKFGTWVLTIFRPLYLRFDNFCPPPPMDISILRILS